MIGLCGVVGVIGCATDAVKELRALSAGIGSTAAQWTDSLGGSFAVRVCDASKDGNLFQDAELTVACAGDVFEDDCLNGQCGKAAIIANVFRRLGPEACTRLNGAYLFFVHDRRRDCCFLGADENAFLPLYYTLDRGGLIYSWDMACLLGTLKVTPRIDEENLWTSFLVGGRGFGSSTRFQHVNRLEAGAVVKFQKGQLTIGAPHVQGYQPTAGSEDDIVAGLVDTLGTAIRRRVKGRQEVAVGLSGGLDSRILLAAGVRQHERWMTYSYGCRDCIQGEIAGKVASLFNLPHVVVTPPDLSYIKYAPDGVLHSGGESLFKHGVQTHLFKTLGTRHAVEGIMLGCALDLSVGGTFTPPGIEGCKDRKALGDLAWRTALNLSQERFVSLFQNPEKGTLAYEQSRELMAHSLERVPDGRIEDINAAFGWLVRVKGWYNHNLVYPLYSNRILAPTYDRDFLNLVWTIPWPLRKDSRIRRRLLQVLSEDASQIEYDRTLQPAWLSAEDAKPFERLLAEKEEAQERAWFTSRRKAYLPSRRYDANFLEWTRVYPEYQKYFTELIAGPESMLCERYFKRKEMEQLIVRHVAGSENNHKLIVMLASMELSHRVFLSGSPSGNNEFCDCSSWFSGSRTDGQLVRERNAAVQLMQKNAFDGNLVSSVGEFNRMTGRDHHMKRRAGARSNFTDEDGEMRPELVSSRSCPLCQSGSAETLFVKDGFPHLRCRECEMVYVSPALNEERLHSFYLTEESWVRVLSSDAQVELDRKKFGYGLDRIEESLPKRGSLLDVGCGTGLFMEIARDRGWIATGLELNSEAVRRLRDRGFSMVDRPLEKVGYEASCFDVITLWAVLEHVLQPLRLLEEVHRIVKPNGTVLLTVPNINSLANRILHGTASSFAGECHVNLFNPRTLDAALAKMHFRVLGMETFLTEMGTINNHLDYRDPYFGVSKWALPGVDAKYIHDHQLGKMILVVARPI